MKTEVIKLFEDRDATLTTYLVENSEEVAHMSKRPAILVCPGGGYYICSAREGEIVALQYLARGYNCFVLRYSCGKGNCTWPRPLEEAEKAMEYILNNADELGVDVERTAVIGFSAGGHLASMLGTCGKIRPKAMMLGYACTLPDICDELAEPMPMPIESVDENTVPAFIFHAVNDDLVDVNHAFEMGKALHSYNIPFEMHIYADGGHGFSVGTRAVTKSLERLKEISFTNAWVGDSIRWFESILPEKIDK